MFFLDYFKRCNNLWLPEMLTMGVALGNANTTVPVDM